MAVPPLDLSALVAEANSTADVEDSATAALQAFEAAVLAANQVSQQAVADVVAKFAEHRTQLASAVANTSGQPPTP